MKIKVAATELEGADVEQISLVKNGANRLPFRILKAEEVEEAVARPTLADQIAGAFKKQADPKVGAVILRKGVDVEKTLEPFGDLECTDIVKADDLFILKTEHFTEDAALFAITEDVGVAVSGIAKEFHPSYGTDFNENLKSQTFFPSLSDATGALMETVYNAMYKAANPDEASSGVEKALSSYTKYVKGLVKNLPGTVFKMDQVLSQNFEGSTVAAQAVEKSIEEGSDMNTAQVKEVMSGDLDGLYDEPVAKAEDKVVTTEEVAAAAEVAKEDAPAESTEPVAEAATEDAPAEEEVVKAEAEVEKTDVTDQAIVDELGDKDGEGEQDPLKLIANALQTMTSEIIGLKKTVETQGERIEEVAKSAVAADEKASEAVEKADTSVVMTLNDIDESLSGMTRTRSLEKSEGQSDDLWKGVMPVFEGSGE